MASALVLCTSAFAACGTNGADGKDGKDGKDGADGVGISGYDTIVNDDGSQTLIFTFTDGNTYEVLIPAPGSGDDGEQGVQGEKGEDGKDGAGWLSGEGAPLNDCGADDDLYLDYSTCDVYKKVSGVWQYICNIKGAAGEDATVQEEKVTLTLDYGYGKTETMTVKKGNSVDLPKPTRDNYEFLGWFYMDGDDALAVTSLTPITRNMTVIAEWRQIVTVLPQEKEIYWTSPLGENVYSAGEQFTLTASINANATIKAYVQYPLEAEADKAYSWGSYNVARTDENTVVTFSFTNLPADYYVLRIVAYVDGKAYEVQINIEIK